VGNIPEVTMRVPANNPEMFIHGPLDGCIQLRGTIQSRRRLNVHSGEAEPNAGIPVVQLGGMTRNEPDAFVRVQFYPEEDEPPFARLPVASEGSNGCALFIHYLFIHEIIERRRKGEHPLLGQRVLAPLSFFIVGAILLPKWVVKVHQIVPWFTERHHWMCRGKCLTWF
jgi:hypothetical protein